jgi:hypothetical protein
MQIRSRLLRPELAMHARNAHIRTLYPSGGTCQRRLGCTQRAQALCNSEATQERRSSEARRSRVGGTLVCRADWAPEAGETAQQEAALRTTCTAHIVAAKTTPRWRGTLNSSVELHRTTVTCNLPATGPQFIFDCRTPAKASRLASLAEEKSRVFRLRPATAPRADASMHSLHSAAASRASTRVVDWPQFKRVANASKQRHSDCLTTAAKWKRWRSTAALP